MSRKCARSGLPPALRRLAAAALAAAVATGARAHGADELLRRRINARIAAAPDDGALYFERAELWRAGGHRDAAIADYKTARRLAPGLAAVDLGLALLWLDAGRPQPSLEAAERFLANSPGHPEALLTRARALVRLGRERDAAPAYAAALAAVPSGRDPQPELYLEYAGVLARGEAPGPEGALRVLDEGIARLGEAITLQLLALEIETARGNPAGALARLDRIIARSPRPEIWRERRASLAALAGAPATPSSPESFRAPSPAPGGTP